MEQILEKGIRLHQMRIIQGNPLANAGEILRRMARDREEGVRLSIFPEWALCGALAPAEWLNPDLARQCDEALARVIEATASGPAVILGTSLPWQGSRVSAVVAAEKGVPVHPEGSPLSFIPKFHSPLDRLDRYVDGPDTLHLACQCKCEPEALYQPFNFESFSIAAWSGVCPGRVLTHLTRTAERLVHLTTRPYVRNRRASFPALSSLRPVMHCGGIGLVDTGKTLFVLTGGTGWSYPNGKARVAPFMEESALDWGDGAGTEAPIPHDTPRDLITVMEFAVQAQLRRLGLKRVIIGASGGIDSALAAALYSRVLPPEDLLLVNMPGRFNSRTTISLARKLATAIGCNYTEIPIEESRNLTVGQIDGKVCERPGTGLPGAPLSLSPFAVENVQARDRSSRILAALSSAFGGVYTCNANKSETTVGYGTLYGDISGFFAVLADLWKLEVWEVSKAYNRDIFGEEIIPQGSIDIVPSAELSEKQNVDEGRGDPLFYPWHDRIFAAWTERDIPLSPRVMVERYRDGTLAEEIGYPDDDWKRRFPTEEVLAADLQRYWKLFQGLARAKRLQAPPLLSLKNRTYGFDLGLSQLPIPVFS